MTPESHLWSRFFSQASDLHIHWIALSRYLLNMWWLTYLKPGKSFLFKFFLLYHLPIYEICSLRTNHNPFLATSPFKTLYWTKKIHMEPNPCSTQTASFANSSQRHKMSGPSSLFLLLLEVRLPNMLVVIPIAWGHRLILVCAIQWGWLVKHSVPTYLTTRKGCRVELYNLELTVTQY